MRNIRRGFTLVEIMVAVILIAITAVSALGFTVYCVSFAMQTNARMAAVNFASETMEGLYMNEYSTLTSGSDLLPSATGDGYSRLRDQYGGTRTHTVTDKTGYKALAVTVSWN